MHFETDGSQQLPYYFTIWRFSGEVSTLGCQGNVSRGHCCHGIAFQPIPAEETVCERGGVSLTHTHTHTHMHFYTYMHIYAHKGMHTPIHTYTPVLYRQLASPPILPTISTTCSVGRFLWFCWQHHPHSTPLAWYSFHSSVFFCWFVLFCFVSCCSLFYMFCFVLKSMANLQKKIPYVKESLPLSNLLPSLVYLLFGSTTSQRDDILILRDVQYVLFF